MTDNSIFLGTDGILTLTGLSLVSDGSLQTGATVTGTLYDPTNNPVSNWNNFSFSDEGSGVYQAAFTAANVPTAGTYLLKIVATKSGLTLTLFNRIIVSPFEI